MRGFTRQRPSRAWKYLLGTNKNRRISRCTRNGSISFLFPWSRLIFQFTSLTSIGSYTIQTFGPCSEACTSDKDTTLTLLADDKSSLGYADDTGNYLPCDELVYNIPEKGNYWIQVNSFNHFLGIGRYALVVRMHRLFLAIDVLGKTNATFSPTCPGNFWFCLSWLCSEHRRVSMADISQA